MEPEEKVVDEVVEFNCLVFEERNIEIKRYLPNVKHIDWRLL